MKVVPNHFILDIKKIINEEVYKLFEEKIYNIPELAKTLEVHGHDEHNLNILQGMLLKAYRQGGDTALIEMYAKISGVQIEAVSHGRYMFANLYDPEQQYEVQSNHRLMEMS